MVRGKVKAAIVMGAGLAAGVIVASVINKKPFYIITNAPIEVTWVEVSKNELSDDLCQHFVMNLLWFCIPTITIIRGMILILLITIDYNTE